MNLDAFNLQQPDIAVRGDNISSFIIPIYVVCVVDKDKDEIAKVAKEHNAIEVTHDIVPLLTMIQFPTKEGSDAFIQHFGGI